MIVFDFRFIGEAVKGKDEDGEEAPTGLSLVAATLKHMKKHYQQLLIPLTIWSGLEQGFFGADFTAVRSLKKFSFFFLEKSKRKEGRHGETDIQKQVGIDGKVEKERDRVREGETEQDRDIERKREFNGK
jgi:hypothetical protein